MRRTSMNYWLSLLVLTAPVATLGAQESRAPASPSPTARVLEDVKHLSSDGLQGRGVGTAGLDSAAEYLARRFRQIGLEPAGTDGYFQPFDLDPTAPALAHAGVGAARVRNVVGKLTGRGPTANEVVIIGAHYDHLGLGGSGSLDPDSTGVVHNGADDNASGTAALLETAAELRTRPGNRRTFYFVAFTAEELGLLGSDYFAKNPTYVPQSAYAMVNFDMVGRMRENALMVIGVGSAAELPQLVDAANARHGLAITTTSDPWGRSDHSSFYAQNMPVVHLFTNTHSEYHRTTDDWELINADGIVRIATYAADLSWTLATRAQALTFATVAAPAPATGGGYGAWLGTIPDMSESPDGVRLSGVRAESPAAEAGLQAGDILVQLGEHVIKNLYDMTDALRAHKPGDTVLVAVMRDGERIERSVTLKSRSD